MSDTPVVGNLDGGKTSILKNFLLQPLGTAPSSPVAAQMYLDTALGGPRFRVGSSWVNHATDASLLGGQDSAYHLARGNHTGTQTASTISDFNTAVRTNRLDQLAAPSASVDFNSQKGVNLTDPTNPQDAATKAYVDATKQGLNVKDAVRLGTAAALPSNTYNSGTKRLTASANGALSVDSTAASNNDRILVKNEGTGSNNGIYKVIDAGSGGTPWILERADDFNVSAEAKSGAFTFISEGTVNADQGWVLTTNDPITLDTTALTFTQFSGAGTITAGAGLTKTGNTLDVGAGTGITVNTDDVAVDTAVVVRKYATNIGDGSSTSFTITHNLGTKRVTVAVIRNSDDVHVWGYKVTSSTTNTITLDLNDAPSSNAYSVVVHG